MEEELEEIVELFNISNMSGRSIKTFANVVAQKMKIDKSVAYFQINNCIKAGAIYFDTKKDNLYKPEDLGFKSGKLFLHKNGFGFVKVQGLESDVFVPKAFVGRAMHGDVVMLTLEKDRFDESKSIGIIREVISHSPQNIVGRVEKNNKGNLIVVPDNQNFPSIEIPKDFKLEATTNDKVVVRLKDYDDKMPKGEIIEVLGESFKPEVEVLGIARAYDLYEKYPEEQVNEARKIQQEVTLDSMSGRRDLTNETIITIDGDDSKDLDDAISLTMNEDGTYHLGVHIADVGNYVPKHGVLDKEAYERATSVYFPRFVYPMLPVELSNGICSLNPQVKRLALSVFMDIDNQGKVINHEICESIIESNERMTYTNVQKILDKDENLRERYIKIVPMLENMEKLSDILTAMRFNRGEVDFELRETKIVLDAQNNVVDIKAYPYTKANLLIESFMLVTNEVVAEHFKKLGIPFVYRVHDRPDQERLDKFKKFIEQYGINFKHKEKLSSKDIQLLFDEIKGQDYAQVVRRVALRTMRKAIYSPECDGHFALSAPFYCHFTSPIRRYPDLEIHRIMKKALNHKLTHDEIAILNKEVLASSKHSSEQERNSDEAERAVDNYYKCKYMEKFIGEEYTAVISGVSETKLWIELPNTIEGCVKVESLPSDKYVYNDALLTLTGERRKFRLGDTINIKLTNVNSTTREINFELVKDLKKKLCNDNKFER